MRLFRTMLLIRKFEERLLLEFATGKLVGTTHVYIGQEANAAGLFAAVALDDLFFSNHRCHGHFLAYGGDPYRLAAELMGRATGLVGGRGGSQHIQFKNFYSNGIQGGIVPVASGMAYAEKLKSSGNIVCVFIGDGTLGEGVLYESLNMAALWKLPLLVVVENNRYAQTTPIEKALAGSIRKRFDAFNIAAWDVDSSDVLEIHNAAVNAVSHVRSGCEPAGLILHTYRFSAHSKGDDLRSQAELAHMKQFDPLLLHRARLAPDEIELLETEVKEIIEDAFHRAMLDPFPSLEVRQ